MSFGDLKTRSITALMLIGSLSAILLSAKTCFGSFLLIAVALLVALIGAAEFARFEKSRGMYWYFAVLLILPAVALTFWSTAQFGICSLEWRPARGFGILMASALCTLLGGLLACCVAARSDLDAVGIFFKNYVVAWLLIGVGAGALVGIAGAAQAQSIVTWLILVVAVNDISAYFVGRLFGGAKLAPAISPGKTVSGTVGGLICGTLCGALLSSLVPHVTSLWVLILPLVITIAAQLGDLLESYLKRIHGLKDSGSLLPGHGGILDRVDAILGAAPLMYAWLFFNSWL